MPAIADAQQGWQPLVRLAFDPKRARVSGGYVPKQRNADLTNDHRSGPPARPCHIAHSTTREHSPHQPPRKQGHAQAYCNPAGAPLQSPARPPSTIWAACSLLCRPHGCQGTPRLERLLGTLCTIDSRGRRPTHRRPHGIRAPRALDVGCEPSITQSSFSGLSSHHQVGSAVLHECNMHRQRRAVCQET